MTNKFDLRISPIMTMANVPMDFAIRATVSGWPFTRILKDGKDITETMVNPVPIENKLVVRLEDVSELVMPPGQEIPANVRDLRGFE